MQQETIKGQRYRQSLHALFVTFWNIQQVRNKKKFKKRVYAVNCDTNALV